MLCSSFPLLTCQTILFVTLEWMPKISKCRNWQHSLLSSGQLSKVITKEVYVRVTMNVMLICEKKGLHALMGAVILSRKSHIVSVTQFWIIKSWQLWQWKNFKLCFDIQESSKLLCSICQVSYFQLFMQSNSTLKKVFVQDFYSEYLTTKGWWTTKTAVN